MARIVMYKWSSSPIRHGQVKLVRFGHSLSDTVTKNRSSTL
jgi:hypothetical protein